MPVVNSIIIDLGIAGGVSVSRSGSPGHEQCFPDEDRITVSNSLYDQYNGTPSLRSMCNDPKQRRQQHIPSSVAGRLPLCYEAGGELDSVDRPGHVFQKEKQIHGGR